MNNQKKKKIKTQTITLNSGSTWKQNKNGYNGFTE